MVRQIDSTYSSASNLGNIRPIVNHFLEVYDRRCLLSDPVLEDGVYVNNNNPKDILRVCNRNGRHCQITKILEDGSEADYMMIKKIDIVKDYTLLTSSDRLD